MYYFGSIISLIIFALAFLIYEKGGRELFDLVTACVFVLSGILFLRWMLKIIRPTIKDVRSIKDTDEFLGVNKPIPSQDVGLSIDEMRIVAATRIEDGESADAVVEYLTRSDHANRSVSEHIVTELFSMRQRKFRISGIMFVGIGAVILILSFVLQEVMSELLSGINRWIAHRIGGDVHTVKLILWGIAFYFSIKGILRILFGGVGIKTKRPF